MDVKNLALDLLASGGYDDPTDEERTAAGVVIQAALYRLNGYVAANPRARGEAQQALSSAAGLLKFVDEHTNGESQ